MEIGSIRVEPVFDGELWLDGGAMFGVVPKKIWEKYAPPDQNNRIKLGMYPLLLFTEPKILIDTGIGNKSNEKMHKIYRIDGGHLLDSLNSFGVNAEDIRIVISTHLHFDHAGGNTWMIADKIKPTFPNARYIIQKKEWQLANHPNERTKASYLKENITPVTDQVEVVDGTTEIIPGISVICTGGHTAGHQIVKIKSKEDVGIYLGDLIPTTAHLPLPFIMAYDLLPLETLNQKKKLLVQAEKEGWILFFEHDPEVRWGRVAKKDGKYQLL